MTKWPSRLEVVLREKKSLANLLDEMRYEKVICELNLVRL